MPKRSLAEQLDLAISAMLQGRDAAVDIALRPLVQIASDLRALPREDFQARLKSELEGRPMATTTAPVALRTFASPRLSYKDAAKAIAFYEKAFGAKESFRFDTPTGIPHAELMIGDSVIMLCDEWPEGGRFSAETWGHSPVGMTIQVPDVDAFVKHAVAAGARLTAPITDQFYGKRDAGLTDPFGYLWNIYTVTEEMSVEEMHRRMQAMMPPPKTPAIPPVPKGYRTLTSYITARDAAAVIEFVKQTFDADELFRSGPGSEGGIHSEVRIGDSMVMIGGGTPEYQWKGTPMPTAFHVYVPDCDATYERALVAGATSLTEPKDQEWGERTANVKDASGNFWYIATFKGKEFKSEGAPTVQPYLHPLRAEPVINFLKRAFGAEELGRYTDPLGVMHHTTLKIGDAQFEMGEATGPYQPMPTMFYLYVPDCDALYKRALAAGASSISAPVDHPYGDRSGAVQDVFGNKWYIATHVKDVTQ